MWCSSALVASMATSCGPCRGVAGEQLDVAAQLLVGRHAVAHGRGAAVGEDGLAVVVGEQGVAADRALGGADAVDAADRRSRTRGGDRAAAGADARRSRCTAASVRTTASVPEETLPKSCSKASPMVSVRTSVPARNATPSAIEAVVRTRRSLCASIPRRVAVNMASGSQVLHVVEDLVGGRRRASRRRCGRRRGR